jgi:hypothetical protein
MRRAHDPSRLCRRGLWLRAHPQQQSGYSRHLRGQCQLAAGDEIELARLPPDFQHNTAQRIAGQRVGGGAQRSVDIGGAHGHQQARIKTEFGQSAHRHRARFNLGEILPHPHQRPPMSNRPSREACNESRCRRALPSFREHLMHRADRKAALQRRIHIGMAEPHPAGCCGVGMAFDALDAAAQGRKHVRACAGHAPVPSGDFAASDNPKPAHLFMICSNIKLTWPKESIGIGAYVFREQSQGDRRNPSLLPLWKKVP